MSSAFITVLWQESYSQSGMSLVSRRSSCPTSPSINSCGTPMVSEIHFSFAYLPLYMISTILSLSLSSFLIFPSIWCQGGSLLDVFLQTKSFFLIFYMECLWSLLFRWNRKNCIQPSSLVTHTPSPLILKSQNACFVFQNTLAF